MLMAFGDLTDRLALVFIDRRQFKESMGDVFRIALLLFSLSISKISQETRLWRNW